jgi:acyl-CoA dehydrogenase
MSCQCNTNPRLCDFSSLGAAEYCIEESIKYARTRKPFGKELSTNQAIQFPIVELATVSDVFFLSVFC